VLAVRARQGTFGFAGLDQYALPVNGIGLYTHDWGRTSRARAACGTDTNRSAPCTTDTEEVLVRHGIVVSAIPGSGDIPEDTRVLLGRDAGADALRALVLGDHLVVNTLLTAGTVPPFEFAIGSFRIHSDGQQLSGLDAVTLALRTGAGVSAPGIGRGRRKRSGVGTGRTRLFDAHPARRLRGRPLDP
jgi:hypothetical protein